MVSLLLVVLTLVSIYSVIGHGWHINSTFYYSQTKDFMEVYPSIDHSSTPLLFGLMLTSSDMNHLENTTIAAVKLAVDNISADKELLQGYSLHYTLTVSQVTSYRSYTTLWIH